MKNRQLAALITFTMLTSLVFSDLACVRTYASNRLNISEGEGKGPSVEVIRVDDEGNEIHEDTDKKSSDKDSKDTSEDTITTSANMSYEEDLSGEMYSTDGIQMTTITVSTAEDMIQLAKDCRLDTWSRDKNIVLTDDIILDGSGFKYIPIFGGIFDGNGHTISGVNVSDSESYTGLFCITQESALIKNLNVQGSLIPSGKQLATGGIVGDNYGTISNCTFDGNINGYDYSGGIAGYNEQSGSISSCKSSGYIMGMHFTGGIAGYNLGTISGCTNEAKINISSVDETVSIKDLSIDQYTDKIKNLFGDNNKQDSTNVINSTVDVGGICGYSQGVIISCINNALVGYEHVGYNIGGIVGRQNGYINLCVNNGEVYGRKDVGGIAGQAEPYVVIDITEDIIGQLTSNMNTLHDLVNVTLNDAGDESNLITARLNMVKGFTDKALNDTSYLANETENFINGVMDSGNEVLERIDYTMDELSKDGGVFDEAKGLIDNASNAAGNLLQAVDDLDVTKYMTDEEKARYAQAKQNIITGKDDYKNFYDEKYNSNYKYEYYLYIKAHKDDGILNGKCSDLKPVSSNGICEWSALTTRDDYSTVSKIVHDVSGNRIDFPATNTGDRELMEADAALNAAANADAIAKVTTAADAAFLAKYGKSMPDYLEDNVSVIEELLEAKGDQLTDTIRKDIGYAVVSTRNSIGNARNAISKTKNLISDLGSKPTVKLPKLSPEYQARSNSLVANIQGMSDNLGFLNNEMNSSNQQLVDDMIQVNDQFNVIMLLIADAIDGVLDADYTDIYEDNSLAVAEDCTDATIADSINYGVVHGDINTSGIAGTMAIEYDFDLESDVTGIKDAATGTTYRTKCVLRHDKNEGYVEGVKNFVGGMCGLQEMGTILHCQNYGKLKSNSGDYVGGISGQSLSTIHDSYTKGILAGRDYIGGITGKGYDIRGCYSLPTITGDGSCHGAIAGDNSPDGRIYANYFVSEDEAGINRVSYSGKAEPVSYDSLVHTEGMPPEFKSIRVSFILDDETIDTEEYSYGDTVSSLPLELSDGEYIKWDWENASLTDLKSDTELVGSTARYLTTLAGLQLRSSGQSSVLVDGKFTEDDLFTATLLNDEDPDIIERWRLAIPDDKQAEHLIRYCPPDGVDDVRIYLLTGNERSIIEPGKMGRYLTFTVPGNDIEFLVEDTGSNIFKKYLKYEIAGGAGILAILLGVIISGKTKKKPAKKGTPDAGSKKNGTDDDIIDIDLDKE